MGKAVLALFLGAAAAVAACGGGGSSQSDEEYLATLCRSTGRFFADLVDSPQDARGALNDWFDTMSTVRPPSDLKAANEEFMQSLGSARITGNTKELKYFGDLPPSTVAKYRERTADIPACTSTNPFR